MNSSKKLLLLGMSILLVTGFAGCDKHPAETAGESIDQTANTVGDKISNASKAIKKQSDEAAEAISDTAITAKIKTAILAEPDLKVLQIHIVTINGTTTLSGSVNSQQNHDKAKAIAAAVTGVKHVRNQLLIKSSQ